MVFDSRAVRLRIPQEDVRVRLDELMTFAGLILWVLQAYIDDTGFGVIFGTELGKLIRYFCLLLFLVRILLSDMHLAIRAVCTAAVGFCYLMMIQQMAGAGITFLQLFVMMMAIRGISFRRLCKVMFWSCLLCYLGILFFDYLIYRSRYLQQLSVSPLFRPNGCTFAKHNNNFRNQEMFRYGLYCFQQFPLSRSISFAVHG